MKKGLSCTGRHETLPLPLKPCPDEEGKVWGSLAENPDEQARIAGEGGRARWNPVLERAARTMAALERGEAG